MKRTTKEINKDFLMRVRSNKEGNKFYKLVGVSGMISIIGEAMFEKFLERAYKETENTYYNGVTTCKLRSGLVCQFVQH